jgi:hypothetical protein
LGKQALTIHVKNLRLNLISTAFVQAGVPESHIFPPSLPRSPSRSLPLPRFLSHSLSFSKSNVNRFDSSLSACIEPNIFTACTVQAAGCWKSLSVALGAVTRPDDIAVDPHGQHIRMANNSNGGGASKANARCARRSQSRWCWI